MALVKPELKSIDIGADSCSYVSLSSFNTLITIFANLCKCSHRVFYANANIAWMRVFMDRVCRL